MANAMFIITDPMLSGILHVDFNHLSEHISYNHLQQFYKEIQQHHPMVVSNEEDEQKLRSIIRWTFKTKFLEIIQSLWKVYRQSGMDDLQINIEIQNIDRNIWPKEIQLLMDELDPLLFGRKRTTRQSSSTENIRPSHIYLTFVDSCFHAFQRKHEELHNMLITKKHHLPDFNNQLQERINAFMKRELLPIQIAIDCQIELIYYEYEDELCRRKLVNNIQNNEQLTLIEQLSQLKFEQERIKSQINLCKYIVSNVLPNDFFKNIPLIHCTRNPNIHDELYQLYEKLKEKIELNKLDHYIESLEMRQEDYQLEFQQKAERFWQIHRTIPNQRPMIATIHNTIDERLSNITNRFTCIEKYKKRFLQVRYP